MPNIHQTLLILLAALLTRLALPGFGLPHLVWIAMIPFFSALRGATTWQRGMLGLLYGFSIWYSSIAWMPQAMLNWTQIPLAKGIATTILLSLVHAIPYLLFGLTGRLYPDDDRATSLLYDTALLTLLLSIFPALFPGHIALGLYQSPIFIQVVECGGMPLLLFCILLVNRCGADLNRRNIAGVSRILPAAVAAGVMISVVGYGWVRLWQLTAEETAAKGNRSIGIVAVQPDIPTSLEGKLQQNAINAAIAVAEENVRNRPGADLVVWPEIPRNIGCDSPEMEQLGFLAHARALNIPLLVNCIDNGPNIHNSALLLDGRGKPTATYHKQILFPFGEYIPWEKEFPLLRRLSPSVSIYRPGTEAKVMDMGFGRRLIPLLCYEAMFGGPIRRGVANGGNILINMTDDAWFGDSNATEMHLAFLPFRVIEYRTPLVRANNSGISAFIAATGEIMPGTKTGLFQRVVQRRDMFIPGKRSLYFQIGDSFLYALMLVIAISALPRLRKRL